MNMPHASTVSTRPVFESRGSFLVRWCVFMMIAEGVGFGLGFGGGRGAAQALGPAIESSAMTAVVAALVGIVEGGVLGFGQAIVLRRRVLGLRTPWWVGATAGAAALCWVIGMTVGSNLSGEPSAPWVLPAAVVGSGLAFGAIIGAAQWLVLARHVDQATRWIGANAVGWAAGLLVGYAVLAGLDESTEGVAVFVVASLAGTAMALIPAVVTGFAIERLTE